MVVRTKRNSSTTATPTKPGTSSDVHFGVVTKENIKAEIPSINPDDIIFCGLTGSTSFYTGFNTESGLDALAPFTVFIALKGEKYSQMQLKDFTKNEISISYSVETTEDSKADHAISLQFTSVQQAPVIMGIDWYGYTLSNIPSGQNWRAPFKCLEDIDNAIYTGSYLERITALLKKAELPSDNYDLSGLAGKVIKTNRSTYSLQLNQSFWGMLKQWMSEACFTCYFNNGVLTFVDSLDKLPDAKAELVSNLGAHPKHENSPGLQITGVFNLREFDERETQPFSVSVQGVCPTNPLQKISGTAGKSGSHYNYFMPAKDNDDAQAYANALMHAIGWKRHYLTGELYSTPPKLGHIYTISWYTPGKQGQKRSAKVVPIRIDYVLTTFNQNDANSNEGLTEWTGQAPSQRRFLVTFLIIDDKYLPCPTIAGQDFRDLLVTHAVTVNNKGEPQGETASKDNMIAIVLKAENAKKPTTVWAYVLKPFALSSGAPPAGTLVFVRFDAFGHAYVEWAVQQAKISTDTVISQAEDNPKQANIVIGTKTSLQFNVGDEKTKATMQPGSMETVIDGGPTKQSLTKEGIEISTKDFKVQASGEHETKVGSLSIDATKAIKISSPSPVQINDLKAK